jgi:hypothetical protein
MYKDSFVADNKSSYLLVTFQKNFLPANEFEGFHIIYGRLTYDERDKSS